MTHYTDRWLLPDGVEEILPNDARKIEQARRQLLDIYRLWGYQLVIPPLLEFTDSLLTGVGNDLDLLTVKSDRSTVRSHHGSPSRYHTSDS